jgi:hypothetical protein
VKIDRPAIPPFERGLNNKRKTLFEDFDYNLIESFFFSFERGSFQVLLTARSDLIREKIERILRVKLAESVATHDQFILGLKRFPAAVVNLS